MRFLIDAGFGSDVAADAAARVIERYPSFLLVEARACPAGVPDSACEPIADERIHVHGRPVAIPDGTYELAGGPHTLVRFAGPVSARWKSELASRGVAVLFWAPPYGACVRLPAGMDADALRGALPFVAGAQPYLEEHCARRVGEPTALARRETGALPGVWDVVCFVREQRPAVEAELARIGAVVLARSTTKVRVRFAGPASALRDVVGVKLVGPARAPKLASAVQLAGALALPAAQSEWPFELDGRGQVVAVADTGLDRGVAAQAELHLDFAARVRNLESWPINASWDDYADNPRADDGGADVASGHGTYIAGLVLASGAKSGGTHRGVAPGAELVFQALEQKVAVKSAFRAQFASGHYLAGRPVDLRQLLRRARELGARIHVNAWGDPANGHYTDDSYECDLFLRECPDALVVFAAGNDASDRDGNRAPDAGSLFAPASAKNVVAIGATEGPLAGAGLRRTWGQLDPTGVRFRAASDRADAISGEPERIALFSCTGPTEDGRIKPDLCAPGTNVVGPRSQATAAQGWGLASPLPHYMYDGGTSAATGVAGGWFALLRQAWAGARGGVAPSGAALKALAVFGARAVTSRRDGREEARNIAGFGRLDFGACAPRQVEREVRLVDELERGLETGDAREFAFVQPHAGAFRAVLAWYDAPGERLVNDLDLALVRGTDVVAWGNHAAGSAGAPDRVNTVERIDVATLAPGGYVLRVSARNVPDGPQPFAVVFARPRASAPDVPVGWLNGVGAKAEARLAQNGVASLHQLRGKSHAELEALAGVRGATLARIEAHLALVFGALEAPLDVRVSRELTLARALDAAPPDGLTAASWATLRERLLALTLAFDKSRLGALSLRRLFGP